MSIKFFCFNDVSKYITTKKDKAGKFGDKVLIID